MDFLIGREKGLVRQSLIKNTLYDERLETLRILRKHPIENVSAAISCMAIDRVENSFLLCGGISGALYLSNLLVSDFFGGERKEKLTLPPSFSHKHFVTGCQWYRDIRLFVSASSSGQLTAWDLTSLDALETYNVCESGKWRPQLHWNEVDKTNPLIAITNGSNNVPLYDLRVGGLAQEVRTKRKTVRAVRWLPSKHHILFCGDNNGLLSVWDVRLMSSIHYKFGATLDYKTLQFDGLHITGADLKKEICAKEGIRAEAFDLLLQDAYTKRSYTAEELIPRDSSVIVQRVPREDAEELPNYDNICPVCDRHFDKGKQLYAHLFQNHGFTKQDVENYKVERMKPQAANLFNCDKCDAKFTRADSLRRHGRKKHMETYAYRISCSVCDAEVANHRQLAAHAHSEHAIEEDDYSVHKITFSNVSDYKEWKLLSEESNVTSHFKSSTSMAASGKVTYLRCHHAFRRPNFVPARTKKSVTYCTAYMKVTEHENGVVVEHCFTHLGHEPQASMLKLNETSREYIVSLLMQGHSVTQTHRMLREKLRFGPKNRLYFVTSRDIRNIANKCQVQPGRLHSNDLISVQMRVDRNCEADGFQRYEQAREASGDGFLLVIINPIQSEWLKKYARRAVCIDDTFNLTAYCLRLATIVVADEYDKALPAAYLLSYRMTENEVGALFEEVKKLLPSFYTDFLMSDDTNTFWNGYKKIFPDAMTKKLLCLWHVQQSIKRKAVTKLAKSNLLEPFMKRVKEVCLTRDRDNFFAKYNSLLDYLRSEGEEPLVAYMESCWSDRAEEWAAFGRLGSCVNTSMLAERFHRTLKHNLMEGKGNVRIDRLLHLLIQFTTETEEIREITMARGLEEGRYRLKQHHKSHEAAVQKYGKNQNLIVFIGQGNWEVKEWNGITHKVYEQYCPCDKQLNNHCKRGCNACPYAMSCTCTMDARSGISCYHIHAALLYARTESVATQISEQVVAPSPPTQFITIDSDDELVELDEIDPVYVEADDIEEESEAPFQHYISNNDLAKDMLQRIDMNFAASHAYLITLSHIGSDEAINLMAEAEKKMEEYKQTLAAAVEHLRGKENTLKLARRAEIAAGRPQSFTAIRKLHKRADVRKERAKRHKTDDEPHVQQAQQAAKSILATRN